MNCGTRAELRNAACKPRPHLATSSIAKKKGPVLLRGLVFFGGSCEIRTRDQRIKSPIHRNRHKRKRLLHQQLAAIATLLVFSQSCLFHTILAYFGQDLVIVKGPYSSSAACAGLGPRRYPSGDDSLMPPAQHPLLQYLATWPEYR